MRNEAEPVGGDVARTTPMAAGLSSVLAPEWAEKEATGTRAALRALGGLTLLLGAVYSAVLVLPYAELDDYSMLANNLLGRRNWVLPTRGGRPLYGGLISLFAGDLTSVTDLWRLRLISVLLIIAVAAILFVFLRRRGVAPLQAGCVAALCCLMPPFQVFASWAVTFAYPLAVLLACAAMLRWQQVSGGRLTRAAWGARLGETVLLLWLAQMINQPSAMFLVPLLGITFLDQELAFAIRLRTVVGGLFALGVSCVLELFTVKAMPSLFGVTRLHRASITHAPLEKARWFLGEVLPTAFNFSWYRPSIAAGMVIGAVCAVGLLLYLRGPFRERAGSFAVLFGLLPMAYLPNLLVHESWASYRTRVALSTLLVVYAYFALRGLFARLPPGWHQRTLTAALVLAVLTSGGWVVWTTLKFVVLPQQVEYQYARARLRGFNPATQTLCVIPGRSADIPGRGYRYDEFALPSSFHSWSRDAMVVLAIRDEGGPVQKPKLQTGDCAATGSDRILDFPNAFAGLQRHSSGPSSLP